MRLRLCIVSGILLLATARDCIAVVDIIIDDSQAEFSSWNGFLQTGTGNNSYDGGYRYVDTWGALDGDPNALSARAKYPLPSGVLPKGDRLYHVYAWVPSAFSGLSDQWHVINAAADGTENFQQDINWAGQFGTNRQWAGVDPGTPFNAALGGRWRQLGVGPGGEAIGPQMDVNADGGRAYHLNPVHGTPWFWVNYQPFYEGRIVFDAIRIIELPGQGIDGDFNDDGTVDAADYVVWRDNEGTMNELPNDPHGGTIDQDQYMTWRANFGKPAGAGSATSAVGSAVPEPATLFSLGLAGLACCACKMRALRGRPASRCGPPL